MNKIFKLSFNTPLFMFLLALMFLPIASMTMVGVDKNSNVLSAQDVNTDNHDLVQLQLKRIKDLERQLEEYKQREELQNLEIDSASQSSLNR